MTRSGVAQFTSTSEQSAIEMVKRLLSYLPQNNTEDPPQIPAARAHPQE